MLIGKQRSAALAAAVAGVSLASMSLADPVSWNLPTGGSWSVGANWSTSSVPTAADDVSFITAKPNVAAAITLDGDQTINSLTNTDATAAGVITISAGTPATSKLTLVSGNITHSGASLLTIGTIVALDAGAPGTYAATWSVGSTGLTIGSSTSLASLTPGASQTWSLTKTGAGTLTVFAGPIAVTHANTTLSQGTLAIRRNANTNYTWGTGTFTFDGGTLLLGVNSTTDDSGIWQQSQVNVTANGGTYQTTRSDGGSISAPISLGGTFTRQGSTGGNLSFQLSNTITIDNATVAPGSGAGARAIIANYGASSGKLQITGKLTDGALGGGVGGPNPLHLTSLTSNALEVSNVGNDYAGGTIIDSANGAAGLVIVTAASKLGTGDVTVASGGRLQLAATANLDSGKLVALQAGGYGEFLAAVGTANGLSKVAAASAGIFGLTAQPTGIDLQSLGFSSLFFGSSAGFTVTSPWTPAGATYRLGGGSTTNALTIGAANLLTSSNALQVGSVSHSGIVTLSFSQDFSGGTTLVNGTLNANVTGALGSGNIAVTGGTLNQAGAATNLLSGGSSLSISGGSVNLNASNNATGGITLSGGTLKPISDAALGGPSSALVLAGGKLSAGGAVNLARTVTLTATSTLDAPTGTSLLLPNDLSGSAGLAITGAGTGTVTLSGAGSTYNGGVSLASGILILAASSTGSVTAGPLGTGTFTPSGGTIQGDGTARTLANPVAVASNFSISGVSDLTFTAPVTSSSPRTITVSNTALTTFSAGYSFANNQFTKDGAGTLVIGAAGTNSGKIAIGGGVLRYNSLSFATTGNIALTNGAVLESSGTLTRVLGNQGGAIDFSNNGTATQSGGLSAYDPAGLADFTVTFGGGTATWANARFVGATFILGSPRANRTVILPSPIDLNSGATPAVVTRTIRVDHGVGSVAEGRITGQLRNTGTGTANLVVAGTGTLELTNNNTYNGTTTINSGATLRVLNTTGSATGPGAVSVNGTLGGTGIITGTVTVADAATLAPGASPGTLTTGALSLANTSALAYELATPGTVGSGVNDLVSVNGALTLDGILNVTALGGFGAGTFRLFDYSGALTNNTLSIGTVPGGFNYAIDTATAGQVNLIVSSVGGPPTWNVDSDGAWLTGSNWTGGTSPNAADAQAVLGSIITAPRTVTIGAPGATVGSLTINNASAYTVAGPGALTLSKTGGATLTVTTGNHTISAPITLASDTTITVAAANTLTASTIRGAKALSLASGTLKLADGAGTSKVTALTLAGGTVPTSTLDLGDNKLIIDYTGASVLPTVRAQVNSGRNGYDANVITNWDGKGIVSSKARTDSVAAGFDLYTIGLINNADLADPNIGRDTYTTFGGLATDDSSVLLRYTYSGDADLNGQVDGDDYALIDNAFNLLIPNFGWLSGDFNYDGNIDGDDYALIDSGFLFQGAPIASAATSAVPEPATLGVIALGAVGLLAKRRR